MKEGRKLTPLATTLALLGAVVSVARAEVPDSTLRGQVTTIDGSPVTGAAVFVYDSARTRRPADFISPDSLADGSYKLQLPAGKYWAVARVRRQGRFGPLAPGDRHSGAPTVVELDPGEQHRLDFKVADLREAARLMRKTREDHFLVTGVVVNAGGAPVANKYVIANSDRSRSALPEYLSCWTGSDGTFELHVPLGSYQFSVASRFPPFAEPAILLKRKVEKPMQGLVIKLPGKTTGGQPSVR